MRCMQHRSSLAFTAFRLAPVSGMTPYEPTRTALERNARFWDRVAPRYEASEIRDMAGYERTLARVRQILQPSDYVLELGCGTGTTALWLVSSCRHISATDVSSRMVTIATKKRQDIPEFIRSRLHFHLADANTHVDTRPQNGWDVILAFNLLHLVPDLDATLAQVVAQMRPGGTFISKTACLGDMNPLLTHVVLPLARFLRIAPPMHVFTQGQFLAALERAGLEVVAVEHHASKPVSRDARPFVVTRRRQDQR